MRSGPNGHASTEQAAKVHAGRAAGWTPASALTAGPSPLRGSTPEPSPLSPLSRLAMTSSTRRALAFILRHVSRDPERDTSPARKPGMSPIPSQTCASDDEQHVGRFRSRRPLPLRKAGRNRGRRRPPRVGQRGELRLLNEPLAGSSGRTPVALACPAFAPSSPGSCASCPNRAATLSALLSPQVGAARRTSLYGQF
jgi:hypothetical protein